ncbi:MAG: GGDEF domain-containing protein [Bryobacteraceae bacterium]|jgi:GGDEF domain-containing protein
MLSIRNNIAELERLAAERDVAVDCYRDAIHNVAAYAVELDEQATAQHRSYVTAVAEALSSAPESLREANATLRALLRDYRGRAAEYLNNIREQLASTARALEEVMESLAQTDGDCETQLRTALGGLRELAQQPAAAPVREQLLSAANEVGNGVEEMRKQHQAHVAQFMTEIHMLHSRIGQLESAASIDSVTQLLTRAEIERHIRTMEQGNVSLLLMSTSGLRLSEVRFNGEVAAELAGAFAKRLRNVLPAKTVIGRWSTEEFVAILNAPGPEAVKAAKTVGEQLSGAYSCLLDGKVVRPDLQVRVTVVERTEGSPERLLERVREFMTRAMAVPP